MNRGVACSALSCSPAWWYRCSADGSARRLHGSLVQQYGVPYDPLDGFFQTRGCDSRVDAGNRSLLRVSLPALPPGRYKVAWRVLSIDSHVTEGDFTFRIAE